MVERNLSVLHLSDLFSVFFFHRLSISLNIEAILVKWTPPRDFIYHTVGLTALAAVFAILCV